MNQKTDWALLFLRIALGAIFVAHGSQKIFVFGHAGVAGFLTTLGVPLPNISAYLLMAAEFGGGILLLLGLLTRIAALSILIAMLVALFEVHLSKGFFLPEGFEYVFMLIFSSLALLIAGGGRFAIDPLIFGKKLPAAT